MSTAPSDRRTRKRLATRQRISDIASRLFIERGFDQVTVDQIAEAADVARMTVFNHFSRKEDMFFDLDEEAREDLLTALQKRPPETSPVEALRLFAHQAIAEGRPYIRFFEAGSDQFLQTIRASEALKARARAIRDELADMLAVALAQTAAQPPTHPGPDPLASLAASLLVATWEVAFLQAHRLFSTTRDIAKANAAFLAIVDNGSRGLKAAIEGSPYV